MRVSEGVGIGDLGRYGGARASMLTARYYAPGLVPGYVPDYEPEDESRIPWRYALVGPKGETITLLSKEPQSVPPGYRVRYTTPTEAATGLPGRS